MYVCMHVCMYVCLSVCLPVCLHACMSVSLSACMHVCLSVCLHACMSVCLSVCMHACLSVHVYVSYHYVSLQYHLSPWLLVGWWEHFAGNPSACHELLLKNHRQEPPFPLNVPIKTNPCATSTRGNFLSSATQCCSQLSGGLGPQRFPPLLCLWRRHQL